MPCQSMQFLCSSINTGRVSYRGSKIDLAFPVQGPRVTIGRENDNMIQLPHEKVSKQHAVILQTKDGWVIEGLGSTNGVIVNGKRTEHAYSRDTDTVKIAPYEFYFETNVTCLQGFTTRPSPKASRQGSLERFGLGPASVSAATPR